jgi:hypothetical protein
MTKRRRGIGRAYRRSVPGHHQLWAAQNFELPVVYRLHFFPAIVLAAQCFLAGFLAAALRAGFLATFFLATFFLATFFAPFLTAFLTTMTCLPALRVSVRYLIRHRNKRKECQG